MPRDNQTKLLKKSKKQEEMNMKKKKNQDSDSDNDSNICSDSDDGDDGMDVQEYRKFISKIFPSKHINNKIKAGNKLKSIR